MRPKRPVYHDDPALDLCTPTDDQIRRAAECAKAIRQTLMRNQMMADLDGPPEYRIDPRTGDSGEVADLQVGSVVPHSGKYYAFIRCAHARGGYAGEFVEVETAQKVDVSNGRIPSVRMLPVLARFGNVSLFRDWLVRNRIFVPTDGVEVT